MVTSPESFPPLNKFIATAVGLISKVLIKTRKRSTTQQLQCWIGTVSCDCSLFNDIAKWTTDSVRPIPVIAFLERRRGSLTKYWALTKYIGMTRVPNLPKTNGMERDIQLRSRTKRISSLLTEFIEMEQGRWPCFAILLQLLQFS